MLAVPTRDGSNGVFASFQQLFRKVLANTAASLRMVISRLITLKHHGLTPTMATFSMYSD